MLIAMVSGLLAVSATCTTILLAHRFTLADVKGDSDPRALRRLGTGVSASIAAAIFFALLAVMYAPASI